MHFKLRYIFLLIAAGWLLSACQSDDPATPGTGSEMTFVVSGLSRATATSNINYAGSQFAICGDMKFKDAPKTTIFDNAVVRYSDGKWAYDDLQYWYPQHEHSFVAMHPFNASGISDKQYSDSWLSFKYTLPDNYKDASDLMVATHRRMVEATPTAQDVMPISLKLWHIMSRLNFLVKSQDPAEKIDVSITVEGVSKTGTFNITPAPLTSGSKQTDDCVFTWTDFSDKGAIDAEAKDVACDADGVLIFNDDDALFAIPQTTDGNDITITVVCTLYNDGVETSTLLASATITADWKPGKIYTYSITLLPTIKDMYIDLVSVKEWQPGSDNEVAVPRR